MPSQKLKNDGLRTWIEIDKAAAENNYKIFRNLIPKNCLLMAVVKSNAYGHGLLDFSLLARKLGADPVRSSHQKRCGRCQRHLASNGVDWFGVDSIVEAMSLREAGIGKNILVLGYTLPERLKEAAKNNISLTVSSPAHLEAILKIPLPREIPRDRISWKLGQPLKIHLKIDTGMRRQGFQLPELPKAVNLLKKLKNKVKVEGIYTHFAAAKNPSFPGDTLRQIGLFEKAVKILKEACPAKGGGGFNPIRHAAATSGAIVFPQSHYDLVRIGIGLYGIWPSKETEAAFCGKINLKPVLTWKTIVGEIKNAAKGDRIGYDFTETFSKPATVAILPIGYWHGFPRSLSSIGRVLIKGKPARVLGRVSMDMVAVDVSDIKKAKIGDEAILIGKDGKNAVSADDIADLCGTSSYEIISRLNPLIKRIVH